MITASLQSANWFIPLYMTSTMGKKFNLATNSFWRSLLAFNVGRSIALLRIKSAILIACLLIGRVIASRWLSPFVSPSVYIVVMNRLLIDYENCAIISNATFSSTG
jgi:hypothetical protein